MRDVIAILYDEFETLDVFGPIEILGRLPQYFNPCFYSMAGGIITSSQNVPVMTRPLSELKSGLYILFIPGGTGAREMVNSDNFIASIRTLAENAEFILTVCTGSILLARTGILDGRQSHLEQTCVCLDKNNTRCRLDKKGPVGKRRLYLYQFRGQCRDGYGVGFCGGPLRISCGRTGKPGNRICVEQRSRIRPVFRTIFLVRV